MQTPSNANNSSHKVEKVKAVSTQSNDSSTVPDIAITNMVNNNNSVTADDPLIDDTEIEPEKRQRKFTFFHSRYMHRPSRPDPKDTKQAQAFILDKQMEKRLKANRNKEKRATVTIAIIVLAFVVCWLPFSMAYLIDRIFSLGIRDDISFKVIFWLGYFNSAVNPILYSIFNRDFREAFHKLLCKRSKF